MTETNTEKLYSIFEQFPKITTDTRKELTGSIYFALKGGNFDGNKFAKQALEKGAEYAVIDNKKYRCSDKYILVEDVLSSLQELAKLHRQKLKMPVIGITGSNGKTTTKELIKTVLSQKFQTTSTIGNLNNHIGVPLTVLSIKKDDEIAIVEMGANHVGEIAELCKICQPTFGIITNIGKAHLEGFGSYEGVKKAKSELYEFLRKTGGIVIINSTDDVLMKLSRGIKAVNYGEDDTDFCQGHVLTLAPNMSIEWKTNTNSKVKGLIKSNLMGKYNFDNLLCAVCVGAYFGVKGKTIDESLSSYQPNNNRSQLIQTSKNKIILDAYNANPSSMVAAISTCYRHFGKDSFYILGDMFELGSESSNEHKKIIDLLDSQNTEHAILIGRFFKALSSHSNYHFFEDRLAAEKFLQQNPPVDKTILIKGSRGMELEKVLPLIP